VVLYETRFNGKNHKLGTSGFLYRSNKLMYDKATSSLWNTLHGTPVIGPLVGKGIALQRRSVVTSTWGEWRKRHPQTTVLSLDTGHRRDYGEGVAYQDYFKTDRVMFTTPRLDKRLPNKREVLALRTEDLATATAIDTKFLKSNPVYHLKVGKDSVVVLTTTTGESRVYKTDGRVMKSWDGHRTVQDGKGNSWKLTEQGLSNDSIVLPRYPSHQSFWFGWHAQFPKTRLIH